MGRKKMVGDKRKDVTITVKTDKATDAKIKELMRLRFTENRSEALRFAIWFSVEKIKDEHRNA